MKVVSPSFEILTPIDTDGALRLIENVGRTCYKSEDKITDESALPFVSGIIKRGHEAVIEHYSFIFELNDKTYCELKGAICSLESAGFNSFIRATYEDRPVASANVRAWRDFLKACLDKHILIPTFMWKFIHDNEVFFPEFKDMGLNVIVNPDDMFRPLTVCDLNSGTELLTHMDMTVRLTNDRGVSHEEVRHRVASYAQESTRYCNYSKDKFGSEITYIDISGSMEYDSKVHNLPAEIQQKIYDEWVMACIDAENHYHRMIELGATPQIARSVLNNSTKTEICITMNLAEWRHFFKLRCAPAAHPAMREIAIMLLKAFTVLIPHVFDDIEVTA